MATTLALLLATAIVSTCASPQTNSVDTSGTYNNIVSSSGVIGGIGGTGGTGWTGGIGGAGVLSNFDGPVAGNPRCPRGEIFLVCGSGCTQTCANFRMLTSCTADCRPGCFCADGLVRDERRDGRCVRPFKCRRRHSHGSHSHEDSDSDSDSNESHRHKKHKHQHKHSDEDHRHRKGDRDQKKDQRRDQNTDQHKGQKKENERGRRD